MNGIIPVPAPVAQVSAAFGAKEDELARCYINGIVDYGDALRDLRSTLRRLVDQVRHAYNTTLPCRHVSSSRVCRPPLLEAAQSAARDVAVCRGVSRCEVCASVV